MSNVGSPSERLLNGENSVDAAAAVTVTGAVSGGRGGRRSGGEESRVSSCSSGSVFGSRSRSGYNDISVVGNSGAPAVIETAIIDGAIVTLPDARGTTPVNSSREATVSRIHDGGYRCYTYVVADASLSSATTRASNGGDDVVTTTERRALALSSVETTTPLLFHGAGSTDARIVSISNSTSATNTAAVVIVDAAPPLFHDDDDDDEDEEEDEDEDEDENENEDYRHYHNRNNMVAAMNEHLSNATTTTTSSSPAAANAVRNTIAMSSSSSSASSAMMTASSNTIVSGNNNHPPTMIMSNVGLGANNGNNCNNARGQEFQEVDCDDVKPVISSSSAAAAAAAAAGILSFPCDFDHMYASMTDGGAPATAATLSVSPLRGNEPRQNDFTEVKHLKELLLLHLDLIQQQSEQIVTKDKLLAALRQENETVHDTWRVFIYFIFFFFSVSFNTRFSLPHEKSTNPRKMQNSE